MKKVLISLMALLSVTVMEAQKNQTYLTLNNGVVIPQFGLGVYSIPAGEVTYNSVLTALKAGYRHIDTAHAYQNERSVGQAIKDSGIPRDSIWVTSKLWPNEYGEEVTPKQLDKMLERLGLDYIDLLLLHHTAAYDEEAYQAMERGVNAGKIHSIGLSNFYEDDVDRMMRIATIKPAVLQNETHPYHQSRSVKAHIAKLGTILEAWFPLGGRGTGIKTLSQHEVITDIAQAHGKSAYQVLLRWHLQCGTIAIPGSSNAAHIAEDYDIFDFELTPDEMQRINALECNHRFASY